MLILVELFTILYSLVIIVVIGETKTSLSSALYHRSGLDFVGDDDLSVLYDKFGESNVVRINRYIDRLDLHAYFIDSNFIITGVTALDLTYDTDVVQKIELVSGSVWDQGSLNNVIVIDERAAERYNLEVGDQFELFLNSGNYYEVIGIVTNVTIPGSDRGMIYLDTHKYNSKDYTIPVSVYLPFSFAEEVYNDPTDPFAVNTVVIKSNSVFSLSRDRSYVLSYFEENLHENYSDTSVNVLTLIYTELYGLGFTATLLTIYCFTIVFIVFGKRYMGIGKEK